MRTLGKYQLREQIGEGGMAFVYRAVDEVTGREVALKTLSVDFVDDYETRSRFFLEARLAGRLSHPNIVTIYELGEDNGDFFIAMEYLRGENLKSRISRGKLPFEDTRRILTEIAGGLAHAHHHGIIHRDIKPSNIFLCGSGRVKILDFGLAHVNSSNLTKTGQVLGTPHYMSPEQVLGSRIDHRSDIFSLGSICYELLTGHKAFAGRFLEKVLVKIVYEEPQLMACYEPSIQDEHARFVRKTLAKNPGDRYPSLVELLRDLARLPSISALYERKPGPATGETTSSAAKGRFSDHVLAALSDGSKEPLLSASSNTQSELSEFLLSDLGPFGIGVASPS
jgi:serine/threonine-protein kinase